MYEGLYDTRKGLSSEDFELIGGMTARLMHPWEAWVHRRVDQVTFSDEDALCRSVSIDFTLPYWAEPEAGGGEGRVDGANNLTYIDVQIGNPSYPPYVPPTEEEGTTEGAANQAPAAAPVKTRERTRMRITLRARQSQVTAGGIAVLEGTAAPARNGARVTLQQRTRTRSGKVVFLNVKSVRLRKHTEERSRFVFRVRARHTATYRALVPGNGDYLKSTSAPVRVQVGP